jgi:Protein of unknown function (DUF1552)
MKALNRLAMRILLFGSLAMLACSDSSELVVSAPSDAHFDSNGDNEDGGRPESRDATLPESRDATLPDVSPANKVLRLVVFATTHGFMQDEFAMRWPGTIDGESWEKSLSDGQELPPWSATLAPLAALRNGLIVLEGLSLQVVMAQPRGDTINLARTSTLTGVADAPAISAARGSSLDFRVANASGPSVPSKLFVIGGLNRQGITFDENGDPVLSHTPEEAHRTLFDNQACDAPERPLPWRDDDVEKFGDEVVPMVVAAFRCDRSRVITLNLPVAVKKPASFDVQDCVYGTQLSSLACYRNYQVGLATQFARLTNALATTSKDGESLLDRTVIVWISSIAGRSIKLFPWNAIVVAGARTGLRSGRYVHFGQNTKTRYFSNNVTIGPAHNHFLVSVARLFDSSANTFGSTSVSMHDGLVLNTQGQLPPPW